MKFNIYKNGLNNFVLPVSSNKLSGLNEEKDEDRIIINFIKYNRGKEKLKELIECVSDKINCSEIIFLPSHEYGYSLLSELNIEQIVKIKKLVETDEEKTKYEVEEASVEFEFDSTRIKKTDKARVLIVDLIYNKNKIYVYKKLIKKYFPKFRLSIFTLGSIQSKKITREVEDRDLKKTKPDESMEIDSLVISDVIYNKEEKVFELTWKIGKGQTKILKTKDRKKINKRRKYIIEHHNQTILDKKNKEKEQQIKDLVNLKKGYLRSNNDYVLNERRKEVWELKLKGYSGLSIARELSNKYDVSRSVIYKDLELYKDYLKEREIDDEEMILLHIGRYEELYQRCMEYGITRLAMYALKRKEMLMGKHKAVVGIQVNNYNNIVEKNIINLNTSRLEKEERIELQKMLKECRK